MKKQILILSVVALFIGACGKTTKGKVANKWKVIFYEEVSTKTNSDGKVSTETLSLKGSDYALLVKDEQSSFNYSETGNVISNTYEIKKDGTWSSHSEVTYTSLPDPDVTRLIKKRSGTWSFIERTKGGDDFKKHERIIFNTLKERAEESDENNSSSQVILEVTYLTGEKSQIYTVKESKAKELKLALEENSNWMVYGETDLSKRTIQIVMEKE